MPHARGAFVASRGVFGLVRGRLERWRGVSKDAGVGPSLPSKVGLVRRREENLRRGQPEDSAPWLFATRDGTPLDETRVRKAVKAVLKKAGLTLRFGPHSLRHTYASLMLAKGAPLHSSPQVTLDWYSWALRDKTNAHASLLDSVAAEPRAATANAEDELVTTGDHSSLQVGAGAQDRTEDLLITNSPGQEKEPEQQKPLEAKPLKNEDEP